MKRIYRWVLVTTLLVTLVGCSESVTVLNGSTELDTLSLFEAMFPEENFTVINEFTVRNDRDDTFYIEEIRYGRFSGEAEEFLVVVRRPEEELSHAQGYYNAWLGLFDVKNKELTAPVEFLINDVGSINFFVDATGKSYVFYAGSTTYQGWAEWQGGLYFASEEKWNKLWPQEGGYWENKAMQVGQDRLIVYKRVWDEDSEQLIPDYTYEIETQLYWEPQEATFVVEKPE